MHTPLSDPVETRPLDILGINEAEERAYTWLLAHPGASVPEIARALNWASGKTQRLADALESKGLATHTLDRPRRYMPTMPDIAMDALLLQRQNDLQRARDAVQKLQEQAKIATVSNKRKQIVELIAGRDAERHFFEQINRAARREIVSLLRPPIRISRLDTTQDYDMQGTARARGVSFRVITDADYLALPGAVQRTLEDSRAGEKIKTVPSLPLKMVAVDHRIALMPLDLKDPDSPGLVVRPSTLLDTLYALFETLWDRAVPVSFSNSGSLKMSSEPDSMLSQVHADLVMLLSAGLNDKKVIDELGISRRTFTRRVSEVAENLNTRTRFQTGWAAALAFHGNGEPCE